MKLFNWLKESNRQNHLLYGSVIFMVLLNIDLILSFNIAWAAISALEVIAGVALALEFKDHCYKNKFDLLDIAATIIVPFILTIICVISQLFV